VNDFAPLEKQIGYHFRNQSWLELAFHHSSHENRVFVLPGTPFAGENFERLEFLGDSLLNFITALFLFENYPHKTEGELTLQRSMWVNNHHLAKVGENLNLLAYMRFGKSLNQQTAQKSKKNKSALVESFLAALYFDSVEQHQWEVVKKFCHQFIFQASTTQHFLASKLLNEKLHKIGKKGEFIFQQKVEPPSYSAFLLVDGIKQAEGWGFSKKEAKQQAAQIFLEKFPFSPPFG